MNDLRQNCELFYKEYLELQAEVDAAFQVQIQPIGTGTYEVRTAPSPEKEQYVLRTFLYLWVESVLEKLHQLLPEVLDILCRIAHNFVSNHSYHSFNFSCQNFASSITA